VTIKDVAKHAGVSPATVSNVMNGTKYVSPDLIERVNEAIRSLDYQVDYIASRMKKHDTHTVGVVMTTFNSVFSTQVITGIQSLFAQNGYRLIFYTSNFNFDKELQYVRTLANSKVDGIILNTTAHESENAEYLNYLADLQCGGKHIPVVSVERNLVKFGIHSVHVNNVLGGELAANHLIECGCRRIALITGPNFSDLVLDRITGYKNILSKSGVHFDEELIVRGDFSALSGYRAANYLLKEGIEFDGVFACNDQMAVGALKALTEGGIAIPDDIKLIGFDNTFVSTLVTPQISTINVPKTRIGSSAARLLLDLMRDEGQTDDLSLEMPISTIIRGSTEKVGNLGLELEGW